MSDRSYNDYRFRFAAADCTSIVPSLQHRNMLGDPLDANGQPFVYPDDPDSDAQPAFFGVRVGDEIYIEFRTTDVFDATGLNLTEITAAEAAAILGVWA